MKNTITRIMLVVLAACVLTSCATNGRGVAIPVPVIGGTMVIGGGQQRQGHPGMMRQQQYAQGSPGMRQQYSSDGHGGPPGARQQQGEPRLVEGENGFYTKSKWQNGVDRHSYKPHAGISTFNNILSASEKFDLANKIDDWAIEQVKSKHSAPTDEEATAEARRIVGHEFVRVKMGNEFSNQHIQQERKLISTEKVDENSVPEASRTRLKNLAEQQFYQDQSNTIVNDGKFYQN